MRRFIMTILFVLLVCLLSSGMAFAQENPTGTLVGVVTDAQGGAVVDAKITVTDMASGTTSTTMSGCRRSIHSEQPCAVGL